MVEKLPRGLRNNNPGNIVDGSFARNLPGYVGSDGHFAVFDSLDAGAHAMQKLLQNYGKKGFDTVESIINRWAPPSENDTNAYANTVAKSIGVKPGDKLDLSDPDTIAGLSSAMAGVENGVPVALGYVDPQVTTSAQPQNAAQAVDAMATGALKPTLVHSTSVPPPFSGGQGDFQPLVADQPAPAPVAPQMPTHEPGPVQSAPVAPPEESSDDILKAFLPADADTSENPVQGAAPQPQETPEDILNSFLPKETPAPVVAAAPEGQSIGQQVGQTIDQGVAAAAPAAKAIGNVWGFDNNVARQVATGVPIIGGLANKADAAVNALIAPAINPMLSDANKLQGATWGERYQNSLAQQNAMDQQFQSDHPIVSTGAQIAGGIGSLGGVAAKVPMAANALGLTGSTIGRTVAGTLSGAALGGADAGVRSGGDPKAIGTGAALGSLTGAIAPAVGNAIGATANKLAGTGIPTRVAELAQLASEKYGINLGPGQLSTNPTIRFLDSVVNKLPLSGGTAAKEGQQAAFNKAVASTFGENASEVTPEVLGAARTRIGKVFDSVAERTPQIQGGNEFVGNFQGILDDAKQTIAESEMGPLQKQADNILGKFTEGNGSITGDTYQALTRKGAPLDRAMNSADPNIRFYAGQMRDSLDNALEQSASPDVLADLQQARSQWKAMKTVEDLAEKSPTGDISAPLLLGQVRKSYGNMAYGQGADLVDLARIGQQFMKEPPSSGTAERSQIMNLLVGGAGGGGAVSMAANPGTIPYVIGPMIGAAATGRAMGTVLRSPKLGNMLVQNALNAGKEMPATNNQLLLRAAGQGSLPEVNRLTQIKPY